MKTTLFSILALALLAGSLPVVHSQPPPPIKPIHIPANAWRFADIHVTVMGPSTVKIDWMPLPGANQYVVNRNGVQVGPIYPAHPNVTQPMNAIDNSAPASSHLTYTVTAYHSQTISGLPGTPGAGQHTGELPMITSNPVAVNTPAAPQPAGPLHGFVDLHTHPMANLGFGGKLLYGGVDIGSLLATDPNCNSNVHATDELQALGHDKSTHGGFDLLNNHCGDDLRKDVIHAFQTGNQGADEPEDATGYPDFLNWPVWNDLTHQKMWVEWIRRAYSGGLRVMVALAVNNKTLGDMVAGPGDYPTDDKWSADLQITEIQNFVSRHSDFMEVAFNSSDVRRIVSANPPKLAVVVGIEVDHIGNFQTLQNPAVPSDADVIAEIDRLYTKGVRYIFPIHVLDNAFGGSAAYVNLFNLSNVHETGKPYELVCADDPKTDKDITYTYNNNDLNLEGIVAQMIKRGWAVTSISYAPCNTGVGQKNKLGLTPTGIVAIKEMMRLGMLIDIDHMSQAAADNTLNLAQQFGYPVSSGHNGIRGSFGKDSQTERSLRPDQYATIGKLHGMAGVGSGGTYADQWRDSYNLVVQTMGAGAAAGFGTDTDGFALGMPPPKLAAGVPVPGPQHQQYEQCLEAPGCKCVPVNDRNPKPCINSCAASCNQRFPDAFLQGGGIKLPVQYTDAFPRSTDGNKTWDYNNDGVAHYGMLSDFLQDVGNTPSGQAAIDNLMQGAEYFYQTWAIVEMKKTAIGP